MPGYLLASSPLRECRPESRSPRAGIRALGEQNEAEGSTRVMREYQDQRPLCREATQSMRTAFGHFPPPGCFAPMSAVPSARRGSRKRTYLKGGSPTAPDTSCSSHSGTGASEPGLALPRPSTLSPGRAE